MADERRAVEKSKAINIFTPDTSRDIKFFSLPGKPSQQQHSPKIYGKKKPSELLLEGMIFGGFFPDFPESCLDDRSSQPHTSWEILTALFKPFLATDLIENFMDKYIQDNETTEHSALAPTDLFSYIDREKAKKTEDTDALSLALIDLVLANKFPDEKRAFTNKLSAVDLESQNRTGLFS